MSKNPGTNPFGVFLGLDGRPLNGGDVYIGLANQDPETNPQQVYWDEDGLDSATQPLETLSGYIVDNGTVARFWTENNAYSIRVRDRLGNEVFHSANVVTQLPDDLITADNLVSTASGLEAIADKLMVSILPNIAALAALTIPTTYGESRVVGGYSSVGDGGSGLFIWDGSDQSTNVTNDTEQGIYVAPDSDNTGASGAWVREYDGALNVRWFGAHPDNANNATAIQAALDVAFDLGVKVISLGVGDYEIATTLTMPGIGSAIVGLDTAPRRTGSENVATILAWTGGASPMISTSYSQHIFHGFSVENRGTATDWLELNSGAIHNTYEHLTFNVPTGAAQFSRSVIRSNGNRCGYSQFKRIMASSPAPIFLDIDDATSNGITPISFSDRCIFDAQGAAFTVIKVQNQVIEGVSLRDSTFINSDFELRVVDTSSNPLSDTIRVLTVQDCEFDTDSGNSSAAWRFFYLTNVDNAAFNENNWNGAGTTNSFITLVNSNVVSLDGNWYRGIGDTMIEADATSTVTGVGENIRDTSNSGVEFDTATAGGIVDIAQATGMLITRTQAQPGRHTILRCDVSTGSSYEFRMDPDFKRVCLPGTVFTIHVRNVSGGAISNPAFASATFNTQGAATAPANGNGRLFTFYWNGTKSIEISRGTADVANA